MNVQVIGTGSIGVMSVMLSIAHAHPTMPVFIPADIEENEIPLIVGMKDILIDKSGVARLILSHVEIPRLELLRDVKKHLRDTKHLERKIHELKNLKRFDCDALSIRLYESYLFNEKARSLNTAAAILPISKVIPGLLLVKRAYQVEYG